VFLVQTFDFVLLYIFNVGWDQGTLCSYAKLNIIQIYRVFPNNSTKLVVIC